MGRSHHPLESPRVAGGEVAMPGANTARQDTLNCVSVKVCQGFRCQAKFLQPPEVEEALLRLLQHTVCVVGSFQIVSDMYAKELEAFHLLHCGPFDVDKGVVPLLCPEVHDQLLCFAD